MLKKILCTLAMPATLIFAYAVPAGANVPPPPVNQKIGLPDTVFNNLVEANCRACHEDTSVVNPGTIPDRHHLLVGKTIPNPTAAPDGTPGGTYACLSCHDVVWNGTSFALIPFRNCLLCHQQVAGTTVHHQTAKALADNCKACHGPIDNPGDGHYVPTYAPSMVTPRPSDGFTTTPPTPEPPGTCAFCHDAGIDTSKGVNITVYSNADTHHGTGLASLGKCVLCHDVLATPYAQIRQCEVCHGVKSLHNIQVDSGVDGIVPGAEFAYFGHIGNNDDCMGCHDNLAASFAPTGSIIPDISGVSTSTVTAGFDTQLTISGAAFINVVQGPDRPIEFSKIRLKAADGSETVLTPDSITEDTIVVMIPSPMAPGNYALSAVKGGSASNSVNLSVMPEVKITSASCANGVVSITGSGFSQYLNATGSGTSVSLPGAVADCRVLSWSDTAIAAQCGECDPKINVDSVFGEASGAVNIRRAIIKKPARR